MIDIWIKTSKMKCFETILQWFNCLFQRFSKQFLSILLTSTLYKIDCSFCLPQPLIFLFFLAIITPKVTLHRIYIITIGNIPPIRLLDTFKITHISDFFIDCLVCVHCNWVYHFCLFHQTSIIPSHGLNSVRVLSIYLSSGLNCHKKSEKNKDGIIGFICLRMTTKK